MKIIDQSKKKSVEKAPGAFGQAVASLGGVFSKKGDKAQDVIQESLPLVLDDRYVLVCNTMIEGLDVPIPFVLVGPTGLWTIYPSDAKGVYRARESNWDELDSKSQKYRPSRPNLLTLTVMMARAVTNHLNRQGIASAVVEPILFFANPGVHVEATRPVARVVLRDAIERFAISITQVEPMLEKANIQDILLALGAITKSEAEGSQLLDTQDAFSFREAAVPGRARPSSPQLNLPRGEPAFAKKVAFKRRQWAILGILVLINIIVLVAVVLYVLLTA
ncbi:MAG: hypothetical protein JXB15_00075 [Anaerolineales bacterium]|nr:hypothetical protein [Anaerolineales bacterium]